MEGKWQIATQNIFTLLQTVFGKNLVKYAAHCQGVLTCSYFKLYILADVAVTNLTCQLKCDRTKVFKITSQGFLFINALFWVPHRMDW